VSGLCNYKGVG